MERYHTDTDDASIVVDILDMAQPVVSLEDHRCCQSTTDSETSYQIDLAPSFGAHQDTSSRLLASSLTTSYQTDDTSEPTYEELKSIKENMIGKTRRKRKLNIPFLDLPSPPSSSSSGSVTPTGIPHVMQFFALGKLCNGKISC